MPPHLYLRYAELVRAYSDKLDLVSPGDLERFDDRHIRDSLRALPYVRQAPKGPAVDVGSGAGLPGIPLAVADASRAWVLLEPRQRRAAFLEEVVRDLELDHVEVRAQTAEEAAIEAGATFSVAIARALAPPAYAIDMLRPLVVRRGTVLLFVGSSETATKCEEVEPGLVRVVV